MLFTAFFSGLPMAVSGLETIGITLYVNGTCVWSAHKDPAIVKKGLNWPPLDSCPMYFSTP